MKQSAPKKEEGIARNGR